MTREILKFEVEEPEASAVLEAARLLGCAVLHIDIDVKEIPDDGAEPVVCFNVTVADVQQAYALGHAAAALLPRRPGSGPG
jgi:hypothetical protein